MAFCCVIKKTREMVDSLRGFWFYFCL